MIDMASVNTVHQHMNKLLMAKGGRLDAVFFCPHAPEDHCDCRKPLPGMMKDIGLRYGLELRNVPMAADTLRDLQAAQAAGCQPHLVRSGRAENLSDADLAGWLQAVPETLVHADLGAFAEHLMRRDAAAKAGA